MVIADESITPPPSPTTLPKSRSKRLAQYRRGDLLGRVFAASGQSDHQQSLHRFDAECPRRPSEGRRGFGQNPPQVVITAEMVRRKMTNPDDTVDLERFSASIWHYLTPRLAPAGQDTAWRWRTTASQELYRRLEGAGEFPRKLSHGESQLDRKIRIAPADEAGLDCCLAPIAKRSNNYAKEICCHDIRFSNSGSFT